jgi:hypothetical protein
MGNLSVILEEFIARVFFIGLRLMMLTAAYVFSLPKSRKGEKRRKEE